MQGNSSLYASRYSNNLMQDGGGFLAAQMGNNPNRPAGEPIGYVAPAAPVAPVVPVVPAVPAGAAMDFIRQFNAVVVGAFAVPAGVAAVAGPPAVAAAAPTDAAVRAAVVAALNVPAGSLANAVANIYDSAQRSVSQQGKTLRHIPKSDEIAARAAAVIRGAAFGVAASASFEGEAYKNIPASEVADLKAYSPLDAAKVKAWDELVDSIRRQLSEYRMPGQEEDIPEARRLANPSLVRLASFSNYGDELKGAVRRARTPPTGSTLGAMRAIGELRVASVPVFRGGNASAHAPLYPRMVMNGGAHPFATLSGGEVEPAAVLQAKIKSLLAQYKTITGQDLPDPLAGQITGYGTAVNDALKAVKKSLQELADANAALAQYPLGLGAPVPTTPAELEAYAKRGAELNKEAERAARKMNKLEEIADLLQQMVNRQNPVVLARN